MSIQVITCPICKKQYKLSVNDPSSLAKKTFTCPNCKYSAPFTTLIKGLSNSAVTNGGSAPAPQVHNATKVKPMTGQTPKAYLTVVGTNSRFVLEQGMYVMGRRSSDSTATLQLAPDISMSRQHARMAVKMVGGKLMAQVMSMKAANPVFLNGMVCPEGKPCSLKSGDTLQLGTTKVVFTI